MSDRRPKAFAPIEADVGYPISVFCKRSGLGEAALRSARAAGLKVRYAGGRAYIIGADFLEFLANCPTAPPGSGSREGVPE
ncbi:MAG: hypothetical protein EXS05_12350 [Planctomycetaceae bacterium]|nr:hypothetical protein [Planctomycetaceae bacterium]